MKWRHAQQQETVEADDKDTTADDTRTTSDSEVNDTHSEDLKHGKPVSPKMDDTEIKGTMCRMDSDSSDDEDDISVVDVDNDVNMCTR